MALGIYLSNSGLENELSDVVDSSEGMVTTNPGKIPIEEDRKQSEMPGVNHEPEEEMDLEEMFAICGVSFPLWSEACLSVLNDAYIAQEIDRSFLRLPDEPTWEFVFTDTEQSHAIAQPALANPNCNVADGQIDPERAEECHPSDLVKIGILKMECSRSLRKDQFLGVDEHGLPLGQIPYKGSASFAESDLMAYGFIEDSNKVKAERRRVTSRLLETGWLRNQCEGVSDQVFSTIDGIQVDESITWTTRKPEGLVGLHGPPTPEKLEEDYRNEGERYQSFKRWYQREQGMEMIRQAAPPPTGSSLGSPSAFRR